MNPFGPSARAKLQAAIKRKRFIMPSEPGYPRLSPKRLLKLPVSFMAEASPRKIAKSSVSTIALGSCRKVTINSHPFPGTQPDVDGFLVGGASLKPEFVDIINSAT